jgi:hypothetical protein
VSQRALVAVLRLRVCVVVPALLRCDHGGVFQSDRCAAEAGAGGPGGEGSAGAADADMGLLSIVDSTGFWSGEANAFEQFCNNYVHERVQQIVIDFVFKQEVSESLLSTTRKPYL